MAKKTSLVESNNMITYMNDKIGYVPSAVNIGIVKMGKEGFLIDTGIDNSAMNKVLKEVDFQVAGAIITHHHADHMGGASKLYSLGVTNIYGPKGEVELIKDPMRGIPYSIFGGASPPKELRNRYLEARSVVVLPATNASFEKTIQYVDTPGHSLSHAAYIIDDVLFGGDAVFTEETIDKYNLLYVIDPKKAIISLEELTQKKFSAMIPGHGTATEDRKNSLDKIHATKEHYERTGERILKIIGEKMDFKEYPKKIMEELKVKETLKTRGATQYFLFQTSIMSYLSNLMDEKKVKLEIDGYDLKIIAV